MKLSRFIEHILVVSFFLGCLYTGALIHSKNKQIEAITKEATQKIDGLKSDNAGLIVQMQQQKALQVNQIIQMLIKLDKMEKVLRECQKWNDKMGV